MNSSSENCSYSIVSSGITLGPSTSDFCLWTVGTLAWQGVSSSNIVVVSTVSVVGPGTVDVQGGIKFVIYGTVNVVEGARLSFNSTDSVEDEGSFNVLAGSSVLLNGTSLSLQSGSVLVNHASLVGTSTLPNASFGSVAHVNINGLAPGGTVTVDGSSASWVNLTTASNYTVVLNGTYSSLITVDHFSARNGSLVSFYANDAILSNVTLGPSQEVTLGNPAASVSDVIVVDSLSLLTPLSGPLTIAHAQVHELQWSGGSTVMLTSSSFDANASTITDVSSSWVATSACTFDFPLVFNGSVSARISNATAPSLTLNGRAHAEVYSWPGSTTISPPNDVEQISTISVLNQSAWVQVYRYFIVEVASNGGTLPPADTRVSMTSTSISNAPTTTVTLPTNTSTLALYLPTDNITAGGDTFTGVYEVEAWARGVSANASVTILADGQQVDLVLEPASVSPTFSSYTLVAELGLLVALIVATAYLVRKIRQERPPKGASTNEAQMAASHPS